MLLAFEGTAVETGVFIVGAIMCLVGAVGVVGFRNPVHSALSLVQTLFGIAVLFVAQGAHFLSVVQVIVYAGAIVVLFLFVIMLLGVDKVENLQLEPLRGQRTAAGLVGIALLGIIGGSILASDTPGTGRHAQGGPATEDISVIGLTDANFVFEIRPGDFFIPPDAPVVAERLNPESGATELTLVDPITGAPRGLVSRVFIPGLDAFANVTPAGDVTAVVDANGIPVVTDEENVQRLGRSLFTDFVFAFEVTSVLLVIAVVGAVVLARRPPRPEDMVVEPAPAGDPEGIEA